MKFTLLPKAVLLPATAVVVLLILAGCQTEVAKVKPRVNQPYVPIRVVTVFDKTGSSAKHGVPIVDSVSLAPLVNFIVENGGEIAVGTIESVSERPLVRFRVDFPPKPPIDSSKLSPNVFLASKARQTYEKQLVRYRNRLKSWRQDNDLALKEFWNSVRVLLAKPADQSLTDVRNAVLRGNAFLSESSASWNGPTRKFAILVSDGEHNVKIQPTIVPVDSVEYLLVPGIREGCLSSLNPIKFEGLPSAIRYVIDGKRRIANSLPATQRGG